MKSLSLLGAVVLVLVTGSFGAFASGHGHSVAPARTTILLPLGGPKSGLLHLRRIVMPLQATGTAGTTTPVTGTPATTGTPVATGTPPTTTPTPTPTSTLPDPVTILQNFATVYQQIQRAHIELVSIAEKPQVEKLTIDGVGDATCKGPAITLKVKATDLLEGTNQKQSATASFIRVKNKTEIKTSGKKATWKAVKNPENVTIAGFPYPIDNPLACPSTVSTGGSGSGGNSGFTDVSKDVVNEGADTFQGNSVWHIHFVDVRTDSTGATIDLVDDFYIGQDHYLPYVLQQTFNDTADGIIVTEKQVTTKVGEKVKVSYHKLGTK